jgi:hypothetical protein
MTKTSTGRPAAAARKSRMPATPRTFAISCGSVTAAAVPWTAAWRANVPGVVIVDSMWRCASQSAGAT